MENSFKQKAAIDSMLHDSLGQLGLTERLKTYKSELRPNVIALLKQYYPSNEGDKNIFYTEAFNSKLGYYDAELLLNNLFLEKSAVSIINYLLRIEILDGLSLKYLSPFLKEYLNEVQINFKKKSKVSEEDTIRFIRDYAGTVIDDIAERDWSVDSDSRNPIRKFLDWFNNNLTNANVSSIYLIFVKTWNFDFEEKETFNNRAIILYHLLIKNLKESLKNGNYHDFIQFIQSLENIKSNLFNDDLFYPFIDTNDSNKYSDGYISRRDEFNRLLTQVQELLKLNSDCTYLDLMKQIDENTPQYLLLRVNEITKEKIFRLDYPEQSEIEKIWNLEDHKELNKLRDYLIEKLYLYERS